MGSTASSTSTPVGQIEIKSRDGHVTVTRTRAATRDEKVSEPGQYIVEDTVTIVFPPEQKPVVGINRVHK